MEARTKKTDVSAQALQAMVVAVAASRDKNAFAQLFAHFAPRLKAYLIRLGTEPGSAEELAQEALIMVWRRASTFDPAQASVGTWIFTIARNKRIDALRRQRKPDFDPNDPALLPEPVEPADRRVEASQRQEKVRKALRSLPPEQVEVVRMAYFEDKAHGTIAEETDLPLGTVKSRLRLAMSRLRKALHEDENEDL
jgi:RNA polymerase sigma-70 factor (ECF subfamily)